MNRVFDKSIIALPIPSHLLHFPHFKTESHLPDFSCVKLGYLESPLFHSIVRFRLVLSHHYLNNFYSVKSNCEFQSRVLVIRSLSLHYGRDMCSGFDAFNVKIR